MTADDNEPKISKSQAHSETINESGSNGESQTLRDSIEALIRAATQATNFTQNIPKVSDTIKNATKALEAIDELRITKSIEAANLLPSAQAAKLPSIDPPKINLPKTIDAAAISLPKLITPAIARPSHASFYGGGETILLSQKSGTTPIFAPDDLGNLVRKAREDIKLSQQGFADLAGVGRRFVSELENGKPTLELGKVLKVAHAAGISLFAKPR